MTEPPIVETPEDFASVSPADDGEPDSWLERWRQRGVKALADATERLPVINTLIEAAERERATGGGLLAGGVAYRLFFWLVPLGLAGAALGSILGVKPQADLGSTAGSRGIAGVVSAAERQAIDQGASARWYLLLLGGGLSVWFGLGVVRALNIVFALAWGEKIHKVRRPLRAGAAFTLFAAGATVGASALSKGISAIGLGPIAFTLTMIIVYGAAAFFVASVFPHGAAPRRALIPGSLLLSVSAIGVHAFVNVYLAPKLGRSISTYGMLGAASVVLLWLFIVARLITVSAFLNAALYRRHVVLAGATGEESSPSHTQ